MNYDVYWVYISPIIAWMKLYKRFAATFSEKKQLVISEPYLYKKF